MRQLTLADITQFLQKAIAEETRIDIQKIDPSQSMGAFGLNSINSVYVLQQLENFIDMELNPLLFWDYPTINDLSQYLYQRMLQGHE